MRRATVLVLIIGLIALSVAPDAQAIVKKERDMNFMTFYVGTSSPIGTYSAIPGDDFYFSPVLYSFDGEDVYDNALFLGFDYGKRMNRWAFSVGFRYINHQLKDTIGTEEFSFWYNQPVKMNEYDIGAQLNYHLTDIRKQSFSPFVGVEVFTGFTTVDYNGLENENRITVALGATFGAEFKLMENVESRSMLSLVSTNSFTIAASGDRPEYLHIGGALRYYFND